MLRKYLAAVLISLVSAGAKEEVQAVKNSLASAEIQVKDARKAYESHQEVLDDLTRQLGDLFTRKNSAAIAYQIAMDQTAVGGNCYLKQQEPGCDFDKAQLKDQLDNAQLGEKDVMQTIETQREVVQEAELTLRDAIDERKSSANALASAEAKVDDDLDLDAIEDGADGIPGGVGGFTFDMTDFELEDVVTRKTPEEVDADLKKLLVDTKNRREMIRAWYSKQREAALKGVYSPQQMKVVRASHADRIKLARVEIEKYKKAVVARYEEYRALYKSRQINQDQWDKVQQWRQRNIDKANQRYSGYRKKVRENYERIRARNEDRQESRRRKLDTGRENALKAIRDVEREYRKKEENLKTSLNRRSSEDYFYDDEAIFKDDALFD